METQTQPALTPKQQLFCDEYLTDMNATRAALRAGYSATTALNGALMRLPKIKMYLDARCEERSGKLHIDQDMLVRELAAIAFGNMGNYYSDDGEPKPIYMLNEDEKAALSSIKTDNAGTVTVKLYNKLGAIEKIARLMRFYEPKTEESKPVYVYLDKAMLDADDKFEDNSFDVAEQEKEVADDYNYIDNDGNPMFCSPINYGPMANVYQFEITDKPNEMISKLNVYESLQKPVAEYAAENGSGEVFQSVDIRTQFYIWLKCQLMRFGLGEADIAMPGYDDESLYHKFLHLRTEVKWRMQEGHIKAWV